MASKVGRNDPCPCGSGAKYKKCCLDADVAGSRLSPASPQSPQVQANGTLTRMGGSGAQALPVPKADAPQRDRSPEEQRWELFWARFHAAPLDTKLELAREVIDTEPNFDGDWAFDLCEGVIHRAQREGRIDEAEALLDLITARHPAAAAEEAHWFACWRTENALLRPDGDVRTALLGWVPHARRNVEFFEAMLDRLRFHDRTEEALAAASRAWPSFRDDPELIEPRRWFLSPIVEMVIDRELESHRDLSPEDPSLWSTLDPFQQDLDREQVREAVRERAARPPRAWDASRLNEPRPAEQDLYLLGLDFRDALHERFGFTRARAELGRQELIGTLLETAQRAPQRKSPRKTDPARRTSGLIPDPACIEERVRRMVSLFNQKDHRVAALALVLGPWLSFLVELGFLLPEKAHAIAGELRSRLESLPGVLDGRVYDPALQADLRRALREPAPEFAGGRVEMHAVPSG